MSENTNYQKPSYLSNRPSGEDLFEGKSQNKIAETIFELIKNKSLPQNVIGLEGKWGTGKSNVVQILSDKFEKSGDDYILFTYDAWAHQEDLTRRTFLEDLITKLSDENKFKGNIDWNVQLKRLLATKSKKTVEKFPKIKYYWLFITASILLFTLFDSVYEDFEKGYILWFKYVSSISLFLFGLSEMFKEYKTMGNDENHTHLSKIEKIKRLLYVFSGTDLETEELEFTEEEEPTVRSFKEYFKKITLDLNSDGLIIVFDNMDRLYNSSKVLSLWSSIHTFFAEGDSENVWVIIPYDIEHLSSHFDENDKNDKTDNFIGKTFSTTYRISPPVLSDWKKFFELKFKEAFKTIVADNDIDFISSLYELITDVNNKRPRDMIALINNLVSLYLQHSSTIDIKYLALFLLRKKEILENPLISISSKNFLKEEKYMFRDEAEIETNLAAIVYNVDKEKSSEILLANSIDDIFLKGNISSLKEVKKHSDFKSYFGNTVSKSNFSNLRPENAARIFDEVEDVIPAHALRAYWERFGNSIDNKVDELFIELFDWHKGIIKNTSKRTSKALADKIVYKSRKEFETSSNGIKYYTTLFNLIKFLNTDTKKLRPDIEKVKFSPKDFVYYLDDLSLLFKKGECEFGDLKIYTDSDELNQYFIDFEDDFSKELFRFLHVIRFIKQVDKSYLFDKIQEKLNTQLRAIDYTNSEQIMNLIEINKVLNGKNKLTLIRGNVSSSFLDHHGEKTEKPYFDIVANQIAHLLTAAPTGTQLLKELNRIDNAEKIAEVLQYYVTNGDLLKIVIEKGREYPLLTEVIKLISSNDYGFTRTLSTKWVIENLDNIKSKLFSEDFDLFLSHFDKWKSKFQEEEITPILDLRMDILRESFNKENHKFSSIKLIFDLLIREFENADKEIWLKNFDQKSNYIYTFEGLVKNDLLSKKITKSNVFMEAYDEYLSSIAKKEVNIPNTPETWDYLIEHDYLDTGKLSRIYDNLLDLLLDYPEIDIEHIKFFSSGIFKYSTISKPKVDDVCRKIILHLKEDTSLFRESIEKYRDRIIKIMNATGGKYNQDLSEMFDEMLSNESIDKNVINYILSKTKLSLNKTKTGTNEK